MDACDVVGAVVIKRAFDFDSDFFRGAKEVGVAFAEDVFGRNSAGANFGNDAIGDGEFGVAADVADADYDGR